MTLEEKKSQVLESIRKLEAYHLIQNRMGRAVVALNFRQREAFLDAFALDDPEVSFEFADEGRFVGAEAVTALVELLIGGEPTPGEMRDYQLTTPIIEISDDGEAARAVWWVPGAGAIVRGDEPEAIWDWGTIAANLVGDGDDWKILNLHFFRYITCLYDKGWADDTSLINRLNTALHPLAEPTTYHNPYSPLSVRDGIPAAPRPFVAADGVAWMLSRDKKA